MDERLQKYMARCGVNSRRKCEELIAQGLVEVNGEVVREPGVKIDPHRDRVKVDNRVLRQEKPAYYIHYKMKGVTTTVSDDLGRRTVMDCLPNTIRERVYPVGRLDMESEGLLLLTNDGDAANYLTHPAHGVVKSYRVVVEGRIDVDILRMLTEQGMRLGPVLVKPSRVELVRYDNDSSIVLISVSEGINREVRRIFAALGHEVTRLLRTEVGPLSLQKMKRGTTRPLTPKELTQLKKGIAGISSEAEGEMYPFGSARSRRPTGPRGRPRRAKAPRQGKPDPAETGPRPKPKAAQERKAGQAALGAKPPRKGRVAATPAAPARTRSRATETRAPGAGRTKTAAAPQGRAPRNGPDKAATPAPRAGKPLRPVKPKSAKPPSRPVKKTQTARPKPPAHPLSPKKSPRGGKK